VSQGEAVLFRRYERRDLDAIVKLDAACFAPPFRFSKAAMRRFAEAENAWVLVAEAQSEIAGFCIVHLEQMPGSAVGYLVTIDVAESFRRKSLGERMLAEGENWVRVSGGSGMLLHVYVKNEGAIRFYELGGYERAGEKPGFYGPGIDAAMYWKKLQK
jgi:ribosomal-protein-alanine N-acetyltransferase